MLILSIFPGIDLLGRAFEEVWPEACVVRGPDLLWGGDIKVFHPPAGVFNGVIGGPPCQAFSRLRLLVRAHGGDVKHGNMIPEFERVVIEAQPNWFLMENVPQAPKPEISGYVMEHLLLNNRHVGGEQHRIRRFSFGLHFSDDGYIDPAVLDDKLLEIDYPLFEQPLAEGQRLRTVYAGNGGGYVDSMALEERIRLQGLPDGFLSDSPFTKRGQQEAIGNGVPLPMGRAIARAVRKAVEGVDL